MHDMMELVARRQAELMAEMNRLEAFTAMAEELEREASLPAAEAGEFGEATEPTAAQPTVERADAGRQAPEPIPTTEAGRAIAKGFRPRYLPELKPAAAASKPEAAPVENVFAS